MDFLLRLIVDFFAALFKFHIGDETYDKIKKVFIFIAIFFWTIVFGYMLVLYLLFSGYEGTWFLYSLNYLHSIFQ